MVPGQSSMTLGYSMPTSVANFRLLELWPAYLVMINGTIASLCLIWHIWVAKWSFGGISDYCDHFTIIVLSLTKNDPPKSDPEKNVTRGICKGHIQSSYRVLGYKSAVNMFLMSDTFPFRFMLETCVHFEFWNKKFFRIFQRAFLFFLEKLTKMPQNIGGPLKN